jgi:predicted site-specific integrase-resolvase
MTDIRRWAMTIDVPSLIPPSEAQRRLGVSRTQMLRLADRGELGYVVRTPLGRLFYPDDVERYAQERREKNKKRDAR